MSPVGSRKRVECGGKLVSPERRRHCVQHVQRLHRVSERRACRVLGQPRTTQRYAAIARSDEDALTAAIIRLASQYGRYGYRRITMLREEGWLVNPKPIYRLWRREGLKVPAKQPKRRRLWLKTARVSGLAPSIAIMCGATISSSTGLMMSGDCGC